MAEDLPKAKQSGVTRRDFLEGVAITGIAAAVGVGMYKGLEAIPGKPLVEEFDDIFGKLRSKYPETARPGQPGNEAYEFREGTYRYTLIKNKTGNGPERIIQSTYYHGIEPDAPSDPIIEYFVDNKSVTAGWLWKMPQGDEVGDKSEISRVEIGALTNRLKGDYTSWNLRAIDKSTPL